MYIDRELLSLTRGFRHRIALAVVMGFLSVACSMLRYILMGWLIAKVFQGVPVAQLWQQGIALLVVIFLRMGLEVWRAGIAHHTAAAIQDRLRLSLYDRLVKLGPAWLAQRRTGQVVLAATSSVEQLQVFFGEYLPQLIISGTVPIILFVILAWWDVPVAAVVSIAAILGLFLPLLLTHVSARAALSLSHTYKAFGDTLLDGIQGLTTLKAFGQSITFGKRLAKRAHELSESTFFVTQANMLNRAVTDLAIAGGAAGAIALGAWRVTNGQMSLEALLIVLMAGTEVFRPLRDLRALLHKGMTANAAAESIKELLNIAIPESGGQGNRNTLQIPSFAFERVSFSYPGQRRRALDDISFSVGAGERVAVVGHSGSGKSTLVKLLLGFSMPGSGRLLMGGHDICEYSSEALRSSIAVVQQDTYLFYGSVEDNLKLAAPEATHEQILAASRAANAHEFIEALPQGYDTVIGERGLRLSGGQKQRLAIARAILRNSPILVLDEALSSVDAENEYQIERALELLAHGRTTLVLAHRLSSVVNADRIIVLHDGKIAASGTHAQLLQTSDIYRELMQDQIGTAQKIAPIDAATAAGTGLNGRTNAVAAEISSARSAEPAPAKSDTSANFPDEPDPQVIAQQPDPDLEPPPMTSGVDRKSTSRILTVLFGYIAPWKKQLVLTVLAGMGRIYALIGVSILSALTVAAVKNQSGFTHYLIWMAVLVPLASYLQWNETWRSHEMAYRLLAQMRVKLYDCLERLAPAYMLRRRSGDLTSLATQDIETVEFFFAHMIAPAFVALLIPATVLAILFSLSWQVAVVLIPFMLLAALLPVLMRRRADDIGERVRQDMGNLNAFMVDTLQGMNELIAFQATSVRRSQFKGLIARYQEVRIAAYQDITLQMSLQEVISSLGTVAVLCTGAYMTQTQGLQAATVPLMALIAVAAFLPLTELAQTARQLADSLASTRRLDAIESEPVVITDGPETLREQREGPAIRFDHVHFSYGDRQVLSDINIDIKPGSKIALVGSSGSGKTTLANLLLRFWDPQEGSICIDGVNLRQLQQDSLRRNIALVAQDTWIFNQTLKENILLGRPDASAEQLQLAIEQAALTSFVATLPDGLDTPVGDRGLQLSGGQRQRISIARAFLKDAPVLILDEATSSLDTLSENLINASLNRLMQGRTTIIIAHRLSTVRSADRILVIEKGRIVESGSHEALLAAGHFYSHLVQRQTVARV